MSAKWFKRRWAKELKKRSSGTLETDLAVASLYGDMTLQCHTCGARFSDKEKSDQHLDWHFQQNRNKKSGPPSSALRPWSTAASAWTQGEDEVARAVEGGASDDISPFFDNVGGMPGGDVGAGGGAGSPRVKGVRADDNCKSCGVCGEDFEQYWNEDEQEWLFLGTVIDSASQVGGAERVWVGGCVWAGTTIVSGCCPRFGVHVAACRAER